MCEEKIGLFFSGIWQGVCRDARIGCGCSVYGSSASARFFPKIGSEVVLVICRIKLTDWGVQGVWDRSGEAVGIP